MIHKEFINQITCEFAMISHFRHNEFPTNFVLYHLILTGLMIDYYCKFYVIYYKLTLFV